MKASLAVLVLVANLLGGVFLLEDSLSQSGSWAVEDARSKAAAAQLSDIMPYMK